MRWRGGEQSGNLEDRRRMGPAGVALGGGGLLVAVILSLIFGVDINQFIGQGPAGEQRELTPQERQQAEFASTILKYTEVVWQGILPRDYQPPKMVLFTGRVQTQCGTAPSAVGPFYCLKDKTIYLDPSFFVELEQKLGGSKADFSQAYVIAHEVGHHVQHYLKFHGDGDNESSVRLELQADYLAGVWAHHGQKEFNFLEPGDIEAAITTANAIGDDRLQRRGGGFPSPEKYTHGTSAQRIKWFTEGYRTGKADAATLNSFFTTPYDRL